MTKKLKASNGNAGHGSFVRNACETKQTFFSQNNLRFLMLLSPKRHLNVSFFYRIKAGPKLIFSIFNEPFSIITKISIFCCCQKHRLNKKSFKNLITENMGKNPPSTKKVKYKKIEIVTLLVLWLSVATQKKKQILFLSLTDQF